MTRLREDRVGGECVCFVFDLEGSVLLGRKTILLR